MESRDQELRAWQQDEIFSSLVTICSTGRHVPVYQLEEMLFRVTTTQEHLLYCVGRVVSALEESERR